MKILIIVQPGSGELNTNKGLPPNKMIFCSWLICFTIQVTSSLVVTSDKINACSVYTQQADLRASRVSVALRPRDQLNTKDADATSLPN